MWQVVIIPIVLVMLAFCLVVLVGPPYLPTLRRQTEVALDLLALKPGQTMLELGSGDGRVMRAAAKRGLNVVGIELNPFLYIISFFVTWKYRKQVKIMWGGYWSVKWPQVDGIFTFMLPRYMPRLDRQITETYKRPVRLASFAFRIPGREPKVVREGIFLYEYK